MAEEMVCSCCEPLDVKMGILRRVPNLRKLSVSPWVNVDRAIKEIGANYVMSRKPSPAVLATDVFNADVAQAGGTDFSERAQGCHIEIILKDISTVRYDPKRLWAWEKMAMRVALEH